jgi:hypothetical protein
MMKPAFFLPLFAALFSALVPRNSSSQTSAGWRDDLVDHLAGRWTLDGEVMGRAAHHDVSAEWVLGHEFLNIREKTSAAAPSSEHRYEASWFLGYDPASERYVLHLLDVFGGRFSETLGYGVRDANELRFVFEYSGGPFHTSFRWSAEKDSWQWVMQQKDKNGRWTHFADLRLTRLP